MYILELPEVCKVVPIYLMLKFWQIRLDCPKTGHYFHFFDICYHREKIIEGLKWQKAKLATPLNKTNQLSKVSVFGGATRSLNISKFF